MLSKIILSNFKSFNNKKEIDLKKQTINFLWIQMFYLIEF